MSGRCGDFAASSDTPGSPAPELRRPGSFGFGRSTNDDAVLAKVSTVNRDRLEIWAAPQFSPHKSYKAK